MKAAAGPVAKAEAADAADIPDGMPVSGILEAGPGFPSISAPRARQGARRAEPRDHGLEREADVRLQSRLKRAGAAWRQELAPRKSRRPPPHTGYPTRSVRISIRHRLAAAKTAPAFRCKPPSGTPPDAKTSPLARLIASSSKDGGIQARRPFVPVPRSPHLRQTNPHH